jgi:CheY-specific phosphatase CheX
VEDGALTTVEQEIKRATLEVFAVLVGCDVFSERPAATLGSEENCKLVSALRLSGSVRGTAHVQYTLPMATRITCRLLDAEPPLATDVVLDAMGEVANMIIGNVKSSLENQWGSIRMGTPRAGTLSDSASELPSMVVDFRWKEEPFSVSLAFQPVLEQCNVSNGIDRWDAPAERGKEGLLADGHCFGSPPAV